MYLELHVISVLCSNRDSILEKGGGDPGADWGPFVQKIGSMFTDLAGQNLLDSSWTAIKVCPQFLPCIRDRCDPCNDLGHHCSSNDIHWLFGRLNSSALMSLVHRL